MRLFLAFLLLATPALAQPTELKFDIDKLCAWQKENNNMDVTECVRLEGEAKAMVPELESKADATRKDDCTKEAQDFSGDSGFASYTVYTTCLKDGPQSY